VIPVRRDGQVFRLDGEGWFDRDHTVHLIEGILDRDRLEMNRDSAPVDPGDHQQVVDEPLQPTGLTSGRGQELLGGRLTRGQLGAVHCVQRADDRGEGGTQLVAHR
jgi:hypothetical protein